MKHSFPSPLAVVSLVLAVLVGAVWIRSYFTEDHFRWWSSEYMNGFGLTSDSGEIRCWRVAIAIKTVAIAEQGFGRSSLPASRNIFGGLIDFSYSHEAIEPGIGGWNLFVPYWFVVLIFSWPLVFAIGIALRKRRIMARGGCPVCGYDLRATPTLCPECGSIPAGNTCQ